MRKTDQIAIPSASFFANPVSDYEARAKECSKTVDSNKWQLVGLMHLADTKE